ncbi:capsid cement protein [uncultured Desulfovibrio sp.]|uniref:capsid cement protein n=1 Tax=uncultured Desulfovibrio sp. TaxID=167968 RepID=UPI00039DD09A|nr:capsid cement protein [uncultured Desulfovibrio sp.]
MPRTDLFVNFAITGDLAPFRIVAHDGAGGYVQAASSTAALIGTTDELGKQANGGADVALNYMPEVEVGAAVKAGDPLTSDAQGRAVPATAAGSRIIGFACKSAAEAGEIIDYQFAPGFLGTAASGGSTQDSGQTEPQGE